MLFRSDVVAVRGQRAAALVGDADLGQDAAFLKAEAAFRKIEREGLGCDKADG